MRCELLVRKCVYGGREKKVGNMNSLHSLWLYHFIFCCLLVDGDIIVVDVVFSSISLYSLFGSWSAFLHVATVQISTVTMAKCISVKVVYVYAICYKAYPPGFLSFPNWTNWLHIMLYLWWTIYYTDVWANWLLQYFIATLFFVDPLPPFFPQVNLNICIVAKYDSFLSGCFISICCAHPFSFQATPTTTTTTTTTTIIMLTCIRTNLNWWFGRRVLNGIDDKIRALISNHECRGERESKNTVNSRNDGQHQQTRVLKQIRFYDIINENKSPLKANFFQRTFLVLLRREVFVICANLLHTHKHTHPYTHSVFLTYSRFCPATKCISNDRKKNLEADKTERINVVEKKWNLCPFDSVHTQWANQCE